MGEEVCIITPKGTRAAEEEMTKQYEPTLAQAVFGTPWAEYECPSIVGELLYELSKELAQLSPEAQAHGFLGGDYGYAQHFKNEVFETHPYSWSGCTCGNEEGEKEAYEHDPKCPEVVPNFRHFATGTEVRWYKYICRGMSTNKELAGSEWIKIIQECIDSLKDYQVPRVVAELRAFFGGRHFQSSQDGEYWHISTGLKFPKNVSDRIRDKDDAMTECAAYMHHWLVSLSLALTTHRVEWASLAEPYWPSYMFPPSCGPDGPSEEYKEKFPNEAAYEEKAMQFFEWDDDPDLPPFTDEHWKAVRWAGINTNLVLTPMEV